MKPTGLISKTSAAFARLSSRERVLVAMIIAVLLLGWATMMLRDTAALRSRLDDVAAARMAQDAWLAAAPVIDATLAAKSAPLDAARSLDAETVMARIEKLLTKARLVAESSRPLTRDAGPCRAYTVSLRAESASMEQLIAFRRELDTCGLPMAITGMELESSDARDAAHLRVRLDITALQPKEMR